MIEMLKNSILQEASSLLTSINHNKDTNNNDKGISFVDMLLSRNKSEKSDNVLDEVKIEIRVEDNKEFKDQKVNESGDQNDLLKSDSKDEAAENKNIQKNKKISSSDNKERIDEEKSNKNFIRINHNKENKNESIKISVIYNNVEYKPELDAVTKDKIKAVLRDLKLGKIDDTQANSYINQIINSSNLQNIVKNINSKDKNIKVEIKKTGNDNLQALDKKKSSILPENLSMNVKNKVHNAEDADKNISAENKSKTKDSIKASDKNKLSQMINNEELNSKELKNDVKADKLDMKHFTIELNGEKIASNPKKVMEDNKDTFFSQIAKNTKVMLSENVTKFSTMIRPENIGRVDMSFTMKDGKINGRLILQNQEAADFFKSNVEELRAVFQKSNVELGNVEIILAGNRFGEMTNSNSNNFQFNDSKPSLDDTFSIKSNIREFEEVTSINSNYSKKEISKVNILA